MAHVWEQTTQGEFEADMTERRSSESRETLTQELLDTLHPEDQEILADYVDQEVTIFRDLTGTIVGIVTGDD